MAVAEPWPTVVVAVGRGCRRPVATCGRGRGRGRPRTVADRGSRRNSYKRIPRLMLWALSAETVAGAVVVAEPTMDAS